MKFTAVSEMTSLLLSGIKDNYFVDGSTDEEHDMRKGDFDEIIAKNILSERGSSILGYRIDEEKVYSHYYNKEEFASFIEDMSQNYSDCYEAYGEGKGKELDDTDGKYPPKMASVASSSRFCYLAFRNGAEALGGLGEVKFEHECRIKGISGIAPQLDAYVPSINTYIEVKCHEIFDSHRIVMKSKYWDLLYGKDNSFGFLEKDWDGNAEFEIPLKIFGLNANNSMFDIKQLLCHLLGISSQKNNGKETYLTYLFFKPQTDDEYERLRIDEVFDSLRYEIEQIFTSAPIISFTEKNNIKLRAICEHSKIMEALTENNLQFLL